LARWKTELIKRTVVVKGDAEEDDKPNKNEVRDVFEALGRK